MSLQFQSQPKKQTDKQLNSINLDISILKGLTKPSAIPKNIDIKPKTSKLSLTDLSSILINKNKKFQQKKEQKKQVIEWLKYKGVDWRKLNLQIKQNALLAQEQAVVTKQKILEKRGVQSVIGVRGKLAIHPQKQTLFTKQMQDEFISKQKQMHLCKIVMKSLRKTKQKNNTRSALMNKIKGESGIGPYQFNLERQLEQDQQEMYTIDKKNVEVLKNQYFDFVKTLSTNGFDNSLHLLRKTRPFWRIVLEHIKTIQTYTPRLQQKGIFNDEDLSEQQSNTVSEYNLKMNQHMMLKSLKMVENQFQKTLPPISHSFEKLDEIVRDMQRRNHRLKIWRNSNGQATWAMTFILLKAGRISEIKRVLESVDRDVLGSIVQQSQLISSQNPQKVHKVHDPHKYNDTFYGQIIRILQGKPVFDPLVLNNQPLTRVWLILRTIGIYRSVKEVDQQFNRINQQLISVECDSIEPIDEIKTQQYFYMGNYKHFIYLCQMLMENKLSHKANQYLTYHDYFHLLTVINYFPQLWGNSRGKEMTRLQGKFSETLVQYMRRLRAQRNKMQLPSYLLLSSNQKIEQIASKVISTPQEYKQFDWKSLKELMKIRDTNHGSKIYKILSKQILNLIKLNKFNDFLFAAETYHINFSQYQDSIFLQQKCYVKLLLAYLYFSEKKKSLIRSNLPTQQFDTAMFSFFGMSQQQKDPNNLIKREKEIKNKVKDCEEKLEVQMIRNSKNQDYISNISIPYAFYKKFSELSRLMDNPVERISELKSFKPKWTESLNETQKHEFLQGFQPVLLRFLGFQFDQSNYAGLYVYYLNQLIERKKILCSIDCDYTGVMSEVRLIAGYLRHLQSHYKKKGEEMKKREGKVQGQQKRIFLQQSTNPLTNCPQYQKLKRVIKEMIGDEIGMGQMYERGYGYSEARMMKGDERRRSGKESYSANEFFREEYGY